MHIHHDSLIRVPSLQSLDLSDNNIFLRQETGDWAFLRPVRFLRRLLLRRAFKRNQENANAQLNFLEIGLRHAHLTDLQFLDLSHNAFDQFPHKLICSTPSLTHLILAHNRFRTLRFDEHCSISELRVIDLRSNRFIYFTFAFSKTANRLPPMSIQVNDNTFDCSSKTCASWHSMMWFRATAVVKDKERVRCRVSGEETEKVVDYLLYAEVDEDLQCPPFGVPGGGSTKVRENPSVSGKNNQGEVMLRNEGPAAKDDLSVEESEKLETGNLTKSSNSSASSVLFHFSSTHSLLCLFLTSVAIVAPGY